MLLPMMLVMLQALAACDAASPPPFQADLSQTATPWTHEDFDAAAGKFTFAVFSDLTGGERDGIFEVAVAQMNLLRPEFVIGVGDLIEGGSENVEQLTVEWDSFDSRARKARAPLFYVGGNHDLTNTVMRQVWEQRYGARYYHFVYKNVLFLVLDTEDNPPARMQEIYEARAVALQRVADEGWAALADTEYSRMPEQTTGTLGPEQSKYFVDTIADNPDVRWTFLFMHKAPWEREGEQNFAAIERALADRPYTVFHGHVHAYRHLVRHGRDYIRLGTTGGVQFPDRELSIDHVTLVTVDQGVDIANLRMSGIFDRTGAIPAGGDSLCYDARACAE